MWMQENKNANSLEELSHFVAFQNVKFDELCHVNSWHEDVYLLTE